MQTLLLADVDECRCTSFGTGAALWFAGLLFLHGYPPHPVPDLTCRHWRRLGFSSFDRPGRSARPGRRPPGTSMLS